MAVWGAERTGLKRPLAEDQAEYIAPPDRVGSDRIGLDRRPCFRKEPGSAG